MAYSLMSNALSGRELEVAWTACPWTEYVVMSDAKFKGLRTLSMGWINFEKAYDRVPCECVTSVLGTIRVLGWVRTTVGHVHSKWSTVTGVRGACGTVRTKPIAYQLGLFQGDAVSPRLFCLAIRPPSLALRKLDSYRIRCNTVKASITHMPYMDDLKLYPESPAVLTKAQCLSWRPAPIWELSLVTDLRGLLLPRTKVTTPDLPL